LDVIWNYAKSVALYQLLLYGYVCVRACARVCACVHVGVGVGVGVCNNFLSLIFSVWDAKNVD